MASISNDGNGLRRILFFWPDGKRRAIRLGKVTAKVADGFRVKLEALIGQKRNGAIDDDASKWLADLPDDVHAKIAATGLARSRERSAATLGKFLADFFAGLTGVKDSTMTAYKNSRRGLLEFFGADKPLRDVEHSDADKYRQWLAGKPPVGQGLAEATISRRIIMVRMIFRCALRWKLIAENPFDGVKTGKQTNKARQFLITRDVADKVMEACPD